MDYGDIMAGAAMTASMIQADQMKEQERRKMNESYVSPILKSLINKECLIDSEELDNEHCTVLDVDAEWIKLLIHGKKGDLTFIERIDSITEIQVV
ncbi:MAG: hypothetical protein IJM75_00605 [Ruminococcus sp.]|nr:hypothetical protein [Ruminococcus sp.]